MAVVRTLEGAFRHAGAGFVAGNGCLAHAAALAWHPLAFRKCLATGLGVTIGWILGAAWLRASPGVRPEERVRVGFALHVRELLSREPLHVNPLASFLGAASVHRTNRAAALTTVRGVVSLSRRRRWRDVPAGRVSRFRSSAALFGRVAVLRLVGIARIGALAIVLLLQTAAGATILDCILAGDPLLLQIFARFLRLAPIEGVSVARH